MSTTKTPQAREQARRVREAYRLEKAQRARSGTTDLAAPRIGDGWVVDSTDNTLDANRVKDESLDMPVYVSAWDDLPMDPGEFDLLRLQWAPGLDPAEEDYRTVDQAQADLHTPFPLTLRVAHTELAPDGPFTLRYEVTTPNDLHRLSATTVLRVDTLPPWRHDEPGAINLPFSELTDKVLGRYPDGVRAELPAYADYQTGDKVAYYWMTSPLPSDPVELPAPVGFTALGSDRMVTYPLQTLSASQDKDYYALYVLFDKAGNRSPISAYTRIDVALGALPDGLQDPLVPLAADGLLDLADAREGVVVHIPAFNNHKPSDRIEATWGAQVLGTFEVGPSPRFPIEIVVPARVLRDEYDRVTGGEQETAARYRVLRGHHSSEARTTLVKVDFSTIGPEPVPDPDPDWPDPVHDSLDPARVFGRSATLNTLVRADGGFAAQLKFNLYAPLQAGEEIDFFWNGTEVSEARYTVLDTDVPDQEVSVEIPWSYIEAAGNNPQLKVNYRIHAPGFDSNYISPVDTLVNVNAITLVAPPVSFEGLSTNGWINCESLYRDPANPLPQEPAARVVVPDLSRFLVDGDRILLKWVALKGNTDEEYPESLKSESVVLGADTPVSGFVWFVSPYEKHLLPTHDYPPYRSGRGFVQYEFDDNSGERIYSEPVYVKVGVYDAAGSCQIPPPIK